VTYAVRAKPISGPRGLSDPTEPLGDARVAAPPSTAVMVWLYGVLVFLPIKIFHFPSNLELVDLWVLAGLPILWLSFMTSGRAILGKAYMVPLFVILIASAASAFSAPNPYGAVIPILKEIFLFGWFVTLATVLSTLGPKSLRAFVVVWAYVAVAHGLLIITQFMLPDIWRLSTDLAGQSTSYAHYRPSGLFISAKAGDANKAAVFQLLGFVPLVLARFSRQKGLLLATFLLCSILATGSMGVTSAFTVGVTASIIAIVLLDRHAAFIKRILVQLALVGLLLGGVFTVVISRNQEYREHFQSIITGRAEKSSGGRFHLWSRGLDALVEHRVVMFGVGPENFRVVDPSGNDNQLHNDFLAFTVERGLVGVAGLILLALIALGRAIRLLLSKGTLSRGWGIALVVFPASILAILFVSITHQIFHTRSLWILLAVQEAMISQPGDVT
jgi:hypothetical protein